MPSQDIVDLDRRASCRIRGVRTLEATYRRPYQMHGSIGPSCAVALLEDERLTVWTHSQGVYPLRQRHRRDAAHAGRSKVRCIHIEGSGCYGHNGADDAAADAALIARALPGRPVRVQWMREQEHALGAVRPGDGDRSCKAALDAGGKIVDWQYDVWSNTH